MFCWAFCPWQGGFQFWCLWALLPRYWGPLQSQMFYSSMRLAATTFCKPDALLKFRNLPWYIKGNFSFWPKSIFQCLHSSLFFSVSFFCFNAIQYFLNCKESSWWSGFTLWLQNLYKKTFLTLCVFLYIAFAVPSMAPSLHGSLSLGQENFSFLSGLKLSDFLVLCLVCGWHWQSRCFAILQWIYYCSC